MRYFIVFLLAYSLQICYCADVTFIDQKMKIAMTTVDGIPVYDTSERDRIVSERTKVAVGTITAHIPEVISVKPKEYEVNLSTIIVPKTRSEYFSCQTKDGLFEKLRLFKSDLDLAVELGDTQRIEKLKPQYDWLKTYYGGLTK